MLTLKSVNFEQRQFQHHRLEQIHPAQMEWIIGRNRTCDLVLPNPEVSRVHGRIVYTDDAYHFVDEGSTSGSLLNGEELPTNDMRQLRPGDLLQLGETFLYVEELVPLNTPPLTSATTELACPPIEWTGDLVCRCCRIVDETPDVKTFCFVAEPAVLFHYLPGQFVNLEVEIEGKPVLRPYSISSSPTRPYHLSVTVKRVPAPANQPDVPAGLVSNWLHDHLQVGDRVKLVGGPLGSFTCLPNLPPKLLLISAGSGVTPMMSMTRWVQDTIADCDVIFLHSARTSDDVVFRSELEAIAAQMPNFHLAITTTQPSLGRPWMGLMGRVSESMLNMVVPDLSERTVYVCGPQNFMQSIRALLEVLQFPMQHYHEESFGFRPTDALPSSQLDPSQQTLAFEPVEFASSEPAEGDEPTITMLLPKPGVPSIHFVQSEQSISTDGTASILEVAEQEGIPIRHACRVGACGACKVRCQGQVRYHTPPTALPAQDQKAGYALACVGYPVDKLVVEA